MIRKRTDSPKSGRGIDGSLGERYSKTGVVDPWNSNPRRNYVSPQGRGPYQDASSGLRNVPANDGTRDMSDARDIWDAVEGQSSDSGNRAVKSGSKD